MKTQKPSSIYAIRCKSTGRIYVGRSQDPRARIKSHLLNLSRGANDVGNEHFQADFDKFGAEDFEGYILEEQVYPGRFREREAFWISEYKATDPAHGYNKASMRDKATVTICSGLPPRPKP